MYNADGDISTLNKIESAIKETFNVQCKFTYNKKWRAQQIVADLLVKNVDDSALKCSELRRHIASRGLQGSNIAGDIHVPIVDHDDDTRRSYMTPAITHSVDALAGSKDGAAIRDLIAGTGNTINITINNTNVVNSGNTSVRNVNQLKEIKRRFARQWISQNQPEDGEFAGPYYDSYVAACKSVKRGHVRIQDFTHDVLALGYISKRINQGVFWTTDS